jgi:hypothetical protein
MPTEIIIRYLGEMERTLPEIYGEVEKMVETKAFHIECGVRAPALANRHRGLLTSAYNVCLCLIYRHNHDEY